MHWLKNFWRKSPFQWIKRNYYRYLTNRIIWQFSFQKNPEYGMVYMDYAEREWMYLGKRCYLLISCPPEKTDPEAK